MRIHQDLSEILKEYYVHLTVSLNGSKDYSTKVNIEKKMNAINILLDLPEVKLVDKLNPL